MHKIRITFLLVTAFFLVAFSTLKNGYELSKNPKEVLAKLKSTASKTTTIEADFTEELFLAAFSKPKFATGKFYYEANDKMRWAQNSPFEYTIMINSESLRIKNSGTEQKNVGSKAMVRKVNDFMLMMINGNYQNDKNMKTVVYESLSKYLLEMTPTSKPLNKIYTKFEMYFSKSDNRLERIIFFQPEGDKKITTFSNQKYNTTIENAIFSKL